MRRGKFFAFVLEFNGPTRRTMPPPVWGSFGVTAIVLLISDLSPQLNNAARNSDEMHESHFPVSQTPQEAAIMRFVFPLFAVLLVLNVSVAVLAQEAEEDEIETDRDAFTRSPRIVAPGRLVLEGSYIFFDQDAEYEGHVYPDLLARYGVNDWLELRLGWTYEEGKFHQLAHAGAEKIEEGLSIYGAKLFVTSAQGWRPDSSLVIVGTTPTSGESNDTDFSLEYTFGWKLAHELDLESQIRYFKLAEEHDHFNEWAPSVVLKGPFFCDRAKAHVEYFVLCSEGREENYQQHYVGPGIHFLLTPNFEIGTRVFWGMGDDAAEFACLSGIGVRF